MSLWPLAYEYPLSYVALHWQQEPVFKHEYAQFRTFNFRKFDPNSLVSKGYLYIFYCCEYVTNL